MKHKHVLTIASCFSSLLTLTYDRIVRGISKPTLQTLLCRSWCC